MTASSVILTSEYWLRSCAAIEVCVKEALLDVLHDPTLGGLPRDKHKLHAELINFKRAKSKSLPNIKKNQWDILCHECSQTCDTNCPKSGQSHSEEFDIQCIAVLIIHLVTGLGKPLSGWKKEPRNNDQSPAAQILRARKLRNLIMHECLGLLDSEKSFDKIWNEIEEILTGLKYRKMHLFHEMKTCSLDPYKSIISDDILAKMEILKTDLRNMKISEQQMKNEMNVLKCSINEIQTQSSEMFTNLLQRFDEVMELSNLKEWMEPLEKSLNITEKEQKLRSSTFKAYQSFKIPLSSKPSSLHFSKNIDRDEITVDPIIIELTRSVFTLGSKIIPGDDIVSIRKKLDQITTNYPKVDLKDLITPECEFTLVTGVPGSGKTTLVRTLLYKWSQYELWDFNFVFLISLGDLRIFLEKDDVTAESIFNHFYGEYADIVKESSKTNCLLLLDGFDDLPQKDLLKDRTTSFSKAVHDLCYCNKPQFYFKSRLMTTRPSSFNLLEETILCRSSHRHRFFELVGFNREGSMKYIRKHLNDERELTVFERTLSGCPQMHDAMLLPFYAWGMCFSFRNMINENQPKISCTSLYASVFLLYLYKHGYRYTDYNFKYIFDEPELTSIILGLSNLTEIMETAGRVTFTQSEMPIDIEEVDDLVNRSGLLIKIISKNNSITYQFLNYTFHEFLVALSVLITGNISIASNRNLPLVAGLIGQDVDQYEYSDNVLHQLTRLFPMNNNFGVNDVLRRCAEVKKTYVGIHDIEHILNELQCPIQSEELELDLVWLWSAAQSPCFQKLREMLLSRNLCIGSRLICFARSIDFELLSSLMASYTGKDIVLFFSRENYENLKRALINMGSLGRITYLKFKSINIFATFTMWELALVFFKITNNLGFIVEDKNLLDFLEAIAISKQNDLVSARITFYVRGYRLPARQLIEFFMYSGILKKVEKLNFILCDYPCGFDMVHRHTSACISDAKWESVRKYDAYFQQKLDSSQSCKLMVGVSCLENPLTASNVFSSKNAFLLASGMQIYI